MNTSTTTSTHTARKKNTKEKEVWMHEYQESPLERLVVLNFRKLKGRFLGRLIPSSIRSKSMMMRARET
jgi:hypothetical protein